MATSGVAAPAIWVSSASLSWGEVYLGSTARGLCCLSLPGADPAAFETWFVKKFGRGRGSWLEPATGSLAAALHEHAIAQLEEYFAGRRREFNLPLDLSAGTPFQQAVWTALLGIPYGQTWSYRQVAEAVGRPRAARAVGQANRANPVPIIVPCHRVIGADGSLRGYGGGLPLEIRLLRLEGADAGVTGRSSK